MIRSEREFFETAIARSGSYNQSAFARKLGVGTGTLSDWKKGRNHPSDKTMLKIADLCQLDRVEALALLNLWRCDEEAKSTYARLLEEIIRGNSRALSTLCAFLILGFTQLYQTPTARAEPLNAHASGQTDYYEKYRARFVAWFRRRFGTRLAWA